jgi:hypothetical protein
MEIIITESLETFTIRIKTKWKELRKLSPEDVEKIREQIGKSKGNLKALIVLLECLEKGL